MPATAEHLITGPFSTTSCRDGWTVLGAAAPVWRATERAAQLLASRNNRVWRLERDIPVRCPDWRGHPGAHDCPAAGE
jgi:hypothetical protein